MLTVTYAECRCAECHYADRRGAVKKLLLFLFLFRKLFFNVHHSTTITQIPNYERLCIFCLFLSVFKRSLLCNKFDYIFYSKMMFLDLNQV
jgi:hypothetical protein